MKKLISLTLSVVMILSLLTVAPFTIGAAAEEKLVMGDVNGDGAVSILDATEIQKHLANLTTLSEAQLKISDIDGDGIVSIRDATQLQKQLTAEETQPTKDTTAPTENEAGQKDLYYVTDFGAVADGITNCTDAFIECINTANGKTIIVPQGTYAVNYCEIYDKAVNMIGAGNAVIKRMWAPAGPVEQPMFKFFNTPSANFENITFDSNRDNAKEEDGSYKNTACVYFYNEGRNIHFSHCTFTNCSREGVYCKGNASSDILPKENQRARFENVTIENCSFINTSALLWLRGSNMNNITFKNNTSLNGRTMGVEVDTEDGYTVKNLKVLNNSFKNICKPAINLTNTEDVLIEGNTYVSALSIDTTLFPEDTDVLQKYFVQLQIYSNSTRNKNIVIRNNTCTGNRLLSATAIYREKEATGTVRKEATDTVYENIVISDNTLTGVRDHCISLARANEVQIVRNTLTGGTTNDGANIGITVNLKNCTNVLSTNNRLGQGYAFRDATSNVELNCDEYNIDTATVNGTEKRYSPLFFSNVKSGLNLSVQNCKGNFDLVNDAYEYSTALFNLDKTKHNVNKGNLVEVKRNTQYPKIFTVPTLTDACTATLTLAEYKVDEAGKPTTEIAKEGYVLDKDGTVHLRKVEGLKYSGRTVRILVTENSLKTEANNGNILNSVTVPAGGVLTLTWTGTAWFAQK